MVYDFIYMKYPEKGNPEKWKADRQSPGAEGGGKRVTANGYYVSFLVIELLGTP